MNRHILLVLQHSLFSAMALLHSDTTLLLRGAGTFCLCFGTSVHCCTVPSGTYYAVSLSFIVTGIYRQTFI